METTTSTQGEAEVCGSACQGAPAPSDTTQQKLCVPNCPATSQTQRIKSKPQVTCAWVSSAIQRKAQLYLEDL